MTRRRSTHVPIGLTFTEQFIVATVSVALVVTVAAVAGKVIAVMFGGAS